MLQREIPNLSQWLLSHSRNTKRLIALAIDLVAIIVAGVFVKVWRVLSTPTKAIMDLFVSADYCYPYLYS